MVPKINPRRYIVAPLPMRWSSFAGYKIKRVLCPAKLDHLIDILVQCAVAIRLFAENG